MHCFRVCIAPLAVVVVVTAVACGSSNQQTCPQGTERCPCYANSTCNSGLTCASNTCVSLGGAGGTSGTGGQAGTTGTGGASKGGTGGGAATGGTNAAGAGGTTTGGSGGSGTGGGGGSCAANTSTDPMNCGACGHVCKNANSVFGGACPSAGCCVNGACGPSPGACITQQSGFTTCANYCASIGETCVAQGCALSDVTWDAWVTAMRCESVFNPVQARDRGACDTPIAWDGTIVDVRCCCTDTH
jgi:hypothetical protein